MRQLHAFSDGQLIVTDNAGVILKGQDMATYSLDQLSEEDFHYLVKHWKEHELIVGADSAILVCGTLSIPL